MSKELTALLILGAIVISSWIGWLVLEQKSILSEVNFSQKNVQQLNPTLETEFLKGGD